MCKQGSPHSLINTQVLISMRVWAKKIDSLSKIYCLTRYRKKIAVILELLAINFSPSSIAPDMLA